MSTALVAQNPLDPGWLWAMRGGSNSALNSGSFDAKYERILDVAVDANNNYYYLAEVGGYTFTLEVALSWETFRSMSLGTFT